MIGGDGRKLYALETKVRLGGMKIKGELGSGTARDLTITLEPGNVSTKITVKTKTWSLRSRGNHRRFAGFNDDMLNELAKKG